MQQQEDEHADQTHDEQGREQARDDEGQHVARLHLPCLRQRAPLLQPARSPLARWLHAFCAFQNGTTPGTASMPDRFLRRAVGCTHCPSQTCGTKFQALSCSSRAICCFSCKLPATAHLSRSSSFLASQPNQAFSPVAAWPASAIGLPTELPSAQVMNRCQPP